MADIRLECINLINELDDNSPLMLDVYRRLKLSQSISLGMEDIASERVLPIHDVIDNISKKWHKHTL